MADTIAHGAAYHEPHAGHAAPAAVHEEGQHHPLQVYFIVWGWLFVLSACSYLVDYVGLQGYLRWGLIILFMLLKAGLIVAVFMHMVWERKALAYAILLPMFAVIVFVAIMAVEADYTFLTRFEYFSGTGAPAGVGE
jgi:cytochrome c oxidase subunit IV